MKSHPKARANRLTNHRLHAAMAPLPQAEFHAPRSGLFPSLAATLPHPCHRRAQKFVMRECMIAEIGLTEIRPA